MPTTKTEEPEARDAFRACSRCGAWNTDGEAHCRVCGTSLSGEYDISFSLTFSVEKCPKCERVSPTSPCVHCDAEIPEVEKVSDLALARNKAFAKPLRRAEELLALYDHLPEPHISVAADQYGTALADSRLLRRSTIVLRALHALDEFGMNDERTIGTTARKRLERLVLALEEIYRATEEIAWFRPPSPEVVRARAAMIASGRHITEVVVTLLRALSSLSLTEVAPLQARFQELLSDYPWAGEFDAALAELRALAMSDDLDERVSTALGTEVVVTDTLGLLDPARVLAAFGGGDDPFTPLAHASAGYLSHLTTLDPETIEAEGAALALATLALAVLDRPLPAHTLARRAVELLRGAEKRDPTATAALLERTSNEGPRVFAAAKRIHDDLHYLAAGYARDEDDVVGRLVATYKRLAESSFRTYLWLVSDAQDIAAGRRPTPADRAPLLGPLEQRLAAGDDALSKTLARAIDPLLRNAEAHEDFRFDPERGEIVLDDKRLTLERFAKRVERLVAATLALDAAFTCRAFETGSFANVPQWLSGGEAPFATELLARGILGAYGLDLVEVIDDGDVTFACAGENLDRVRALTPLAAMAQLFPRSGRLVVVVDGQELVAVKVAALAAFAAADEQLKDLALLAPLHSASIEAGRDRHEVIADMLALFIGLIATGDVPHLKIALAIGNPQPFDQLEARLGYVVAFVREREPKLLPQTDKVVKTLAEAKAMSFLVRRGDAHAPQRLGAALARAINWANHRGFRWPPV